ncbi:MAG: hypothetical protein LBL47_00275 [Lactobacillus sp.]|jgi:hypothetical protein|nr:hypothetical protein [Lactobacillus sp.]
MKDVRKHFALIAQDLEKERALCEVGIQPLMLAYVADGYVLGSNREVFMKNACSVGREICKNGSHMKLEEVLILPAEKNVLSKIAHGEEISMEDYEKVDAARNSLVRGSVQREDADAPNYEA